MCGICGFTHLRSGPNQERIWEVTRSINHRGPDQQGIWESPVVSLGAVRLKIIDLEHGAQPMLSEDGDTVLLFNGEIYNHAEIRAELEQRGRRFDSRCDTEVVLRSFLEWDVESFSRLRGMFGAALWTQSKKRGANAKIQNTIPGSIVRKIIFRAGRDRRQTGGGRPPAR